MNGAYPLTHLFTQEQMERLSRRLEAEHPDIPAAKREAIASAADQFRDGEELARQRKGGLRAAQKKLEAINFRQDRLREIYESLSDRLRDRPYSTTTLNRLMSGMGWDDGRGFSRDTLKRDLRALGIKGGRRVQ